MYRVAMQECNQDWIACVVVVAIVNGVPSQVYICLIQLLIFAQVCCVRSVNGEMWSVSTPKMAMDATLQKILFN